MNFRGFRRRLRRRTGVGFHSRSEFGLRAFGAAKMKPNGHQRDRPDRFGPQTRRHRPFFRIALAAERQMVCFPAQAHQTIPMHPPNGLLTGVSEGFPPARGTADSRYPEKVISSIASAHDACPATAEADGRWFLPYSTRTIRGMPSLCRFSHRKFRKYDHKLLFDDPLSGSAGVLTSVIYRLHLRSD